MTSWPARMYTLQYHCRRRSHTPNCSWQADMHRRAPRSSRGPVIATSWSHLFTCYHYMFINIPVRTSDCVERMVLDPLRAVVQVAYRKGSIYEYTCVSRRAILNLLMNPNMSLGFWVNSINRMVQGNSHNDKAPCRQWNQTR